MKPTDWQTGGFWPDVGLRVVNNMTGVAATPVNLVANVAGAVLFDVPAVVDELRERNT